MAESKKPYLPTAAVIIIGNEILSGRTVDQNIPYLAKKLNNLGIKLSEVHIIGDIAEIIINTITQCMQTQTYVFTTGGIGPTHDDITIESVAKVFNRPLTLHPGALAMLEKYYQEDNLNEARLKMARLPRGAELIANPVSLIPGFYLENVFVMAGVPDIMRAMFDSAIPLLTPGPKIHSETVHCLLGESILASELALIQTQYPDIEIGSYPYFRNKTFGLSLVLRGLDESRLIQAKKAVSDLIKAKGGEPT